MKIKQGKYLAEKVKYKDGIGCCIWIPLKGMRDSGICFDFAETDIDDLIKLLKKLKDAKPVAA